MTPGDIVESYQGLFAKVIRVTEGGHTHLSAWVRTRQLAEEEKVAVIALNEYGLSQVLKGGENTPSAEALKAETVDAAQGGEGDEKPLDKMTVEELKALATSLELPTDGKKADLVARIAEHRAAQGGEGGAQ